MAAHILDKVGSVGAVISAAAVPCCSPFLSLIGSILGLAFLAPFEQWILYIIQGMVLLALVGSFIAYRGHKKVAPLALSVVSTASILYGINTTLDTYYIYGGMLGLLIVSVWNSIEARRCATTCTPN